MEIEMAKAKLKDLNKAVGQLLAAYSKETGLKIQRVDIVEVDEMGQGHPVYYFIDCEVKLNA